jgi:O-acetyl-ADP-ribose deacetylase (regulator of RNase III)
MLVYRRTSLLESSAQTLVNTVNCVGVMGKGIAKEFRQREPEMFEAYKKICEDGKLQPGKLWLWRGVDQWTLNFPTKVHWRNPSKLEWVEAGLKKFVSGYDKLGIKDISFPRLGCGNGGLDWDDVRPLMEKYLGSLKIPVFVHDYSVDIGIPEHLEAIVAKLTREQPELGSFADFQRAVRRVVELSGGQFAEVHGDAHFNAAFSADAELVVRTDRHSWTFSEDDLWSIWIGLQRGLLTGDRAGWVTSAGAAPLLSLVALLPNIRPIEVQSMDGRRQLALEYRARGRSSSLAPTDDRPQLDLSWH